MADVTTASKQTERSRKTAARRKCVSSRLRSFVGFSAGEGKPEHISRISITMNSHVTLRHYLNCRAPGGIVNWNKHVLTLIIKHQQMHYYILCLF
jgi:hypothetical protein